MSKIFDFVKPGVITGDDVQKVFQVAKENNFALMFRLHQCRTGNCR